MSGLVEVDYSKFGLTETKAKQVSQMYSPMLAKMEELEEEFNKIALKEVTKEVCNEARELRMKFVKIRTGSASIHKELKHDILKQGRYIDSWKNAQSMASEGKEAKLKEIELHFEKMEAEKLKKIGETRETELREYGTTIIPESLGKMDEQVWDNFLMGTKINYENEKQALIKADEDRKIKYEADRKQRIKETEYKEQEIIKNEKIRLENEKLKREKEQAEKAHQKKLDKIAEENAQREAERAEKQAKIDRDRAENEAEVKKLSGILEAQRARAEQIKLQKETKARLDAEKKLEEIKKEKWAIEQAELGEKDSDKVKNLITDLEIIKTKYSFKSKTNKDMYSKVQISIGKIINIIK